jgi:ABC-type protease/lipase transport system fused ATPase/permease subunit
MTKDSNWLICIKKDLKEYCTTASIFMGRVLAPFDAAVHTWKFLNQTKVSHL